jgi:hypothetical protein
MDYSNSDTESQYAAILQNKDQIMQQVQAEMAMANAQELLSVKI